MDQCSDSTITNKIRENLLKENIKILTDYSSDNKDYLFTDFMIMTYSDIDKSLDLSFNIATRSDVAAYFTLMLSRIVGIDCIHIMEIYSIDENGKFINGLECIQKHQENLKKLIIDDFVKEEVQLHYLKTHQLGSEC
jgi:hypothetical protein